MTDNEGNMQEGVNPASSPRAGADPHSEPSSRDPFSDSDAAHTDPEDEEGEDLVENQMADYQAVDALDDYEREGLDDEADMDLDEEAEHRARQAAEADLDARDEHDGTRSGRRRGGRRTAAALYDEDDDMGPRRRRRRMDDAATGELDFDDEEEWAVELDNLQGNLKEQFAKEEVRREIARRFRQFLTQYSEEGKGVYAKRIQNMCTGNKQSLDVNYFHLSSYAPTLAIWLADYPRQMLEIFHKVAHEVVTRHFEDYDLVHEDIFVRITNLPVNDSLRDIRQEHLNALVKTSGVVTRRSGVFPQLQQVKYDCGKCGFVMGPFFQNSEAEIKPSSCPQCQSQGPFNVNVEQTVYRNYQKITLQESPGTVPAGRLPRYKEVILLHDLIDCARPGEEIEVTGVYSNSFDASLNTKNGFPVFQTVIEANYVSKKDDLYAANQITDEDIAEIHALSRDPRIGERIFKSIAPSIYGHGNIKAALALSMFGGMEKNAGGKHRLRGDINVLLLGDPGVAKSQFLKYVEKTAHRAVYTTGKGASAVGLTAAVHKDPITREWTLEGGALVLADRGVCLIDEFDKMNEQDRVSIHEAMEQQSISISKAGIVSTLQARCAVMAAANPVGGRYDPRRTFTENVELTDPILSRFDVLCVVRDEIDPVLDERLAAFVVGSHVRSHPHMDQEEKDAGVLEADPDILTQEMLRKYITYAKKTMQPKMQHADVEKITNLYAQLRRESSAGQGVPIAVRHLESLVRMSEAHAKMHLREYVNDDDVDMAIRVMLDSFISTQKQSVQQSMKRTFRRFLTHKKDYNELLMDTLRTLVKDAVREHHTQQHLDGGAEGSTQDEVSVDCKRLEERAQEFGIADLGPFYESNLFHASNFRHDQTHMKIVRSL